MKKDMVGLLEFLLDKKAEVYKDGSILTVEDQASGLKVMVSNLPEHIIDHVQLTVKELNVSHQVACVVQTPEITPILRRTWQALEEFTNRDLIQCQGEVVYKQVRSAVLDALQGKKQSEKFKLSLEKQSGFIRVFLENKENGIVNSLITNTMEISVLEAHWALSLGGSIVVPHQTDDPQIKWTTKQVQFFIPTVELHKYNELNYHKDLHPSPQGLLEKFMTQLKNKNTQKAMSAFFLENSLPNKDDKKKKNKL